MMKRLILPLFIFSILMSMTAVHATPELLTSADAKILVCGGAMMNGNHFADSVIPAMTDFYAGTQHVALVLHASVPADRDKMEVRLKEAFAHIGVPYATSLHQLDGGGAITLLKEADAIFIGGGDTFALLRELRMTGQLAVIQEQALAGIPVGGTSAGANVLGPVIGTTNDFPVTDVPSRDALSLFPALINPHHPKPEDEAGYKSREWKIHNYRRWNPGEVVLGLGDRAIAVLRNGKVTLPLGPAWLYASEESRALDSGDDIPELDPR
jgi:dipeptidase E